MMEEPTLSQRNSNFSRIESIKHYCRVCTGYSKSKKTQPEDSIRIFSRTGLKSILQKFLHLEVSEDDPLPKTICKKCFEKLMAIEYLQIVAKRSENLFKDFLSNRAPKPTTKIQARSDLLMKQHVTAAEKKPEEVIVDVSMSDPLTKDIKKKLQVAQSKRDSIGLAFSPDCMSRNAVTSSPINQVPVTIVHRMPKKRKVTPIPLEPNQIVQIPQQKMSTNFTTVTLEDPPQKKFPILKPKMNPPSPLRHISEAPSIPQNVEIHPVVTGNNQVMGHGMPLGSIIKDVDLLKLILKALKWPYNSQTLDIQIQRLKNTNFNDVIVDPNLLQDTDLIQILGPLIAPLPVTMRQQTYHITIPPETLDVPPTTMSYKLPAETSVQIITVPASEKEKEKEREKESSLRKERPLKRHTKSSSMRKRSLVSRPKMSSQVIVVSDDSEDDPSLQTATANDEIPNFEVQLDPAVYPSVGENSNSNEAMLATLNRQREAMMRMHRSKRKQSLNCAKNVEMVDDIMIVDEGFHMDEPYPPIAHSNKIRESVDILPIASTSQRKPVQSKEAPPFHPLKSDTSQIKPQPAARSKSMTSMKPVKRLTQNLKPERVSPVQGFVKLKESPSLPPLKRVKVLPKTTGFIQVKEASKLIYMSKNTTVADADSTTKTVTKESRSPKPSKPVWNLGKISKAKRAAEIHKRELAQQSSTGVTQQETVENQKTNEEAVVVIEEQDKSDEKAKKEQEEAILKKKKSLKNATPARPETRKSDMSFLATFDVSDDDMESLQVEDPSTGPSTEPSVGDKTYEPSTETTETSVQAAYDDNDVEKISSKTAKQSKPSEVEKNQDSEIKGEGNQGIRIKSEDQGSTDQGQVENVDTNIKGQKPTSRISVKAEFNTSTRSSKRKVQKEEEVPVETPSFRPARRSKTLSKYYKGPPLSGTTTGRSMRSRT